MDTGLTVKDVNVLYDALLTGLEDYSIDERGDVGSWIRMACIRGLATVNSIMLARAQDLPDFPTYLPSDKYQAAVAGILKQGVERLDNVRQEAGQSFLKILDLSTPSVEKAKHWEVCQASLFRELFYRFDLLCHVHCYT
jgi:tubulin-specific chaperone D